MCWLKRQSMTEREAGATHERRKGRPKLVGRNDLIKQRGRYNSAARQNTIRQLTADTIEIEMHNHRKIANTELQEHHILIIFRSSAFVPAAALLTNSLKPQ